MFVNFSFDKYQSLINQKNSETIQIICSYCNLPSIEFVEYSVLNIYLNYRKVLSLAFQKIRKEIVEMLLLWLPQILAHTRQSEYFRWNKILIFYYPIGKCGFEKLTQADKDP